MSVKCAGKVGSYLLLVKSDGMDRGKIIEHIGWGMPEILVIGQKLKLKLSAQLNCITPETVV